MVTQGSIPGTSFSDIIHDRYKSLILDTMLYINISTIRSIISDKDKIRIIILDKDNIRIIISDNFTDNNYPRHRYKIGVTMDDVMSVMTSSTIKRGTMMSCGRNVFG